MIKFKVKINGINKGREDTHRRAQKVLQKSMFKMEELAIRKAPFDTGFLRENITLFPEILSDKYVLTSKAPYSEDLEYGNTPRNVKFDDIEAWAERKGINKEGFVPYVVEKIKTQGVNAHPFMRPSLNQVKTFWMPKFMREGFE